MRFLLIFLPIIFINCGVLGQNITIEGHINGYSNSQALLSSLYGHTETPIDTIEIDEDGNFSYSMKKNSSKGLYRLNLRNQEYLDLIVMSGDIRFKSTLNSLIDSLVFEKSEENKVYYSFYKESQNLQYKIELLTPLLKYYPKEDPFYKEIIAKFKEVQSEIINKIEQINEAHKSLFASKLISSERDPILYWNPEVVEQDVFLKNHFLDFIDFQDNDLLKSDLFPSKAIQYISIFGNKNLDKDEQGKEFIKAIDNVLAEASVNKIVFDYLLEYIIEGFERFEYDNVMSHLAEAYITDETCKDDKDKEKLKKRIELYKKFSIGKPAPDFEIKNTENKKVKLSNIDAEYTLLVFWAGWCDHCEDILPEVVALYNLQESKKMKVIAISLDKKKDKWLGALKGLPKEWINVSELKGWDSKIAEQYNIYATPTFLVLDSEKKIVSKPENTYELEQFMIAKNIFF